MNKQQLASKIWESANKMRSKIEANEYKDYILGFMFYKFLSDKEVKWLKENDWTDEYLPDLTKTMSKRWIPFGRMSAILSPMKICFPHGSAKAATSRLTT